MDRVEVARRVDRFERTLDPRDLWPDVTERTFTIALREMLRVTALRLARSDSTAVLSELPPDVMPALGPAAFASGLGPLLGYWIEVGSLAAPPSVAGLLKRHLDHGRRRAARLRAELERIVRIFGDIGVDVVVLKGLHTASALFPDPGTRPVSDIDVLVRPDRLVEVRRVLEREGFALHHQLGERSTWEPPGGAAPAAVDLTHADNPWTLDLHHTLDRWFPGADAPARFDLVGESDARPWWIGGSQAHVLTGPMLACYLAVHASNHFPYVSAIRLVELVLVLRQDGGGTLWDGIQARFGQLGTLRYAYPALKLANDLSPGVMLPRNLEWLRGEAPRPVRRLVDRATPVSAHQMYRRSFEGRFLWAPTRRRRLAAFLAWLWPRDSDGGRLPTREAVTITGHRLRRLMAGRLSWWVS